MSGNRRGLIMSRFSSIDIMLYGKRKKIVELISMLLNYGWTLNDYGRVSYLPIGVNGKYDWASDDISKCDLISLIKLKEDIGEQVGIVMTWKDTLIGGQMLFYSDMKISFILSINRQEISNTNRFTDVTWYLEKIIPALASIDVNIESIKWDEHV